MSGPVHIAITRRVRTGCEREFERRLQAFAQRSLAEPGARGIHCLHPPAESNSREYGLLRTFASETDRQKFYQSSLFQEWLAEIAPLVEGEPEYRELTGLEAWFRDPTDPRPPRWKMAILTWLAVWPVGMAVAALLKPVVANWPHALASALISAGIVASLTWAAMPLVVKVAHPWLRQNRHRSKDSP